LRLLSARGAIRTGRRHHRAMGRGGVATVRAGYRVARNRLPGASGRPENRQPLRFQGDVQSDLPGQVRQSPRMGIALALRDQSGADQSDDRELSNRFAVALDARLPVRHKRVATSGIHRWLVMTFAPHDSAASLISVSGAPYSGMD